MFQTRLKKPVLLAAAMLGAVSAISAEDPCPLGSNPIPWSTYKPCVEAIRMYPEEIYDDFLGRNDLTSQDLQQFKIYNLITALEGIYSYADIMSNVSTIDPRLTAPENSLEGWTPLLNERFDWKGELTAIGNEVQPNAWTFHSKVQKVFKRLRDAHTNYGPGAFSLPAYYSYYRINVTYDQGEKQEGESGMNFYLHTNDWTDTVDNVTQELLASAQGRKIISVENKDPAAWYQYIGDHVVDVRDPSVRFTGALTSLNQQNVIGLNYFGLDFPEKLRYVVEGDEPGTTKTVALPVLVLGANKTLAELEKFQYTKNGFAEGVYEFISQYSNVTNAEALRELDGHNAPIAGNQPTQQDAMAMFMAMFGAGGNTSSFMNASEPPPAEPDWDNIIRTVGGKEEVPNKLPVKKLAYQYALKEKNHPENGVLAALYELPSGAPAVKMVSMNADFLAQYEGVALLREAIKMGKEGNHQRLVIDVSGNGGGSPLLSFQYLAMLIERFDSYEELCSHNDFPLSKLQQEFLHVWNKEASLNQADNMTEAELDKWFISYDHLMHFFNDIDNDILDSMKAHFKPGAVKEVLPQGYENATFAEKKEAQKVLVVTLATTLYVSANVLVRYEYLYFRNKQCEQTRITCPILQNTCPPVGFGFLSFGDGSDLNGECLTGGFLEAENLMRRQVGGKEESVFTKRYFPDYCKATDIQALRAEIDFFFPEIVVLTDGRCGSACAAFMTRLQLMGINHPERKTNQRVRIVTYGGIKGQPPAASSFIGGLVMPNEMLIPLTYLTYFATTAFLNLENPRQSKAMNRVWERLPMPSIDASMYRINFGEDLGTWSNFTLPLEFYKNVGDYHWDVMYDLGYEDAAYQYDYELASVYDALGKGEYTSVPVIKDGEYFANAGAGEADFTTSTASGVQPYYLHTILVLLGARFFKFF